ncbi:MAG: lamin tail domain-containing protein, partial [Planctomycetota bacterium]
MKTLLISLVFIAFLAGSIVARPYLEGDLDGNYRVDFKDLRMFGWQWLDPDCLTFDCIADIDNADGVNMADFALLAKNWQIEEPHLVISEFMASNASNKPPLPPKEGDLLDGNGASSDWIEIYNPSGAAVNLDGWFLTDSEDDLTKWQFPDGLDIKPGEFLIVFASDKNYVDYPNNYPYLDSLDYYHTNFELDKDPGEYLALVAPDGNTVIHEYAPKFPVQLADISYGLTQYSATLVPRGMTASYHVPSSGDAALGAGWTAVDFNDSEWDTGQTGIGFGLGGSRMVAYNDCVYSSDGQYIANNVTTYGIGSGYSGSTSGPLVDKETGDDMGITVTVTESGGVNWQPDPDNGGSDCAVGTDAHNTFGGISDMTGVIHYGNTGWRVDLMFTGLDPTTEYTFATSANRGNSSYSNRLTIYTLTGADTYTNASTNGVDVLAGNKVRFITGDNYSKGYVARWTGITAADGSFTVRAEADPNSANGYKAYSFDVFMLEGGLRGTDVNDDMLGANASLWMRTEFNLEEGESEIFDTLTLRMKYEDGFAAYLNGQPVTSRNAPNSMQWDSTALSDRPDANASAAEVINIMSSVYALQDGRNVLAIHGLNDDANDPNFLILPELVAARNMSVPQYFTTATPNKFNVPGAKGIAGQVWFSHKRGFYDTGFQLILSTGDDNAWIRYTRDGSRPTITHGFTYTGPLNVDKTTTIRAVAVKPGYLDSEVEAHTYIFVDDVILQDYQATLDAGFPSSWGGTSPDYGMDPDVIGQNGDDLFGGIYTATIRDDLKSIPTLSILMDVNDMFGTNGIYTNSTSRGLAWERRGSAELIYPDNSREGFQINCGVRIQGGWFRQHSGTKKHSLRLLFKGMYGETKLRYPWFGEDAVDYFDTIVLRAGANDGYSWSAAYLTEQYTRDEFGRSLQQTTGNAGSHGTFVHLYINGIYWGLYNPVERPDEAFAASYYGGNKEEWDSLHDGSAHNGDKNAWNQMLTKCSEAQSSNAAYQQLQGNDPNGTPNPDYPHLMDVPNYIDYLIVNLWGGNWDWPWKNWWAGRHRSADSTGFKFFCWDYENTMGNNRSRSPLDKNALNNNFSSAGEPHQSLKLNAEYRMLFADRVHRFFFNGAILTSESLTPRYQELAARVERSIVAESARWGDQHHHPPLTLQQWYNERGWILDTYLPDRTGIVLQHFIDASPSLYPSLSAPVFSINGSYQHGGHASRGDELTMDNPPSGTIYYTLDGSDPREPITGNAVGTQYTPPNPITLNKSTHVKARVLDGTTWSALNEAIYAIGPVAENLRITEIMYHPRNTGDPNDPNEEYIELKNIGQDTLNLNLVKFTEGIHFTFPDMELDPNEFVLVAKDQSAFEAKYGTSVNMTGPYIGSLANNGEQVRLQDAIGRTILDLEYEDDWRPITDGDGFSLTVIDYGPDEDEGLFAHWKFNEGSGIYAMDSAGTNHGILNGGPTWTTGQINGALSFDGIDDHVVVGPIIPLTGDTVTAQAWIRLDKFAGATNPILTQKSSVLPFGYFFLIYNDKPDVYLVSGSGSAQVTSPETINPDQWYH